MKTNVYIDGYNLYYRAVRGTAYKWLDLGMVSQMIVPGHQINRIRFFTAASRPLPYDPGIPIRQQTYIRTLRTIAHLTVHWGQFKPRTWKGPLVGSSPQVIGEIKTFEEKGTDVNLAAFLLKDGYDGDYEQAVVISNDADFALPISIVRDDLHLSITVVNPNRSKAITPAELTQAATQIRQLRERTLQLCQFPLQITDAHGTIHKPATW